ncbi:MAG: TetR/AcrR family transcriptional regulator [Tepidisphaeraceae bacterium]
MAPPKESLRQRNRRAARDAVLDAAERLLKSSSTADFSMRALAAEAGVGFATPFNHFKSKTEIMRAISSRLIDRMSASFLAKREGGDLIDRAMAMCDVTVNLILKQPDVHRAVIGSLGIASDTPSAAMLRSKSLWGMVLNETEGGIMHDAANDS